jgi:hypothetical protein
MEIARKAFYAEGRSSEESEILGFLALTKEYGDHEPSERNAHKSWLRVAGAYLYYLDEFPLGQDPITPYAPQSGIEFTFALPLPEIHPDTGDPLVFAGRFDLLGAFNNGIYVVDDKTCSQLGASWSEQWSLRGQFIGYCWAAEQYGFQVNGVIVRGICLYKDKYGLAQAIEYYPPWLQAEWEAQLHADVAEMITAYNLGLAFNSFPKNLSDSCTSYGGCSYRELCRRQNPEPWIAQNFTVRVWNPLDKGD